MTTRRSRSYFRAVLVGVVLHGAGGSFSVSHADVTASGLNTTVNVVGNNSNITGGTRPGNGTNLFHSFGNFSLNTPEAANFLNDSGLATNNIISRVTGGNPSNIFGTINTAAFGSANLFLMNPAGILFGATARLNVGGSFHATTADYIKLGADGVVYADPAKGSVLTAAAPTAFGFLNPAPAPINVVTPNPGVLRLPVAGKTLSLVGGTVNVGATNGTTAGYVLAPAGRVNLVSVASPGEAAFDGTGFNVDGFTKLGDINLRGGSIVDGKEVFIRGGRLVIDNSLIMPGAFAFLGAPVPQPNGGEVNIKVSNDVTVTGTALEPRTQAPPGILVFNGSFTSIASAAKVPDITINANSVSLSGIASIQTNRLGPGDPANVSINANTVKVENGAGIGLFNFFEGSGGNLIVNAQQVELSGNGGPTAAGATGFLAQGLFHPGYFKFSVDPRLTFADGGTITVNAPGGSLIMRGDAQITTDSFAFGRSGDVTVNARDIVLAGAGATTGAIAAQSILAGNAGNVTINATGSINLSDGFRISANTGGSGNGGSVRITAGEGITLTGANSRILNGTSEPSVSTLNSLFLRTFNISYDAFRTNVMRNPNATLMQVLAFLNSRGTTRVTDLTPGDAGTITINTPVLTMNADTRIEASTGWEGNAGAIVANVNSLFLNDGASIRNRSGIELISGGFSIGPGNAGTVNITAADTISVSGHSPTSGAGSAITTSTLGAGNGGDIVLNSAETVQISNGGIVTADSTGTGLAGNITIAAGDQIQMNSGSVSTRAVTSDGGNIILNAPRMIQLTDSQVTTSVESGFGGGGNITIDPEALILNNSRILANAFGGPGGNINITADVFLVNSNGTFPTSLTGIVDASSALSTPGTINIQANFTNVTGSVTLLPETPLKATELLRAACAARFAGGKTSSLVVGGRDGLPLQPGDLLPSPLYVANDANTAVTGTKGTGYNQFSDLSLLGSRDRRLDRYTLLPNSKCS